MDGTTVVKKLEERAALTEVAKHIADCVITNSRYYDKDGENLGFVSLGGDVHLDAELIFHVTEKMMEVDRHTPPYMDLASTIGQMVIGMARVIKKDGTEDRIHGTVSLTMGTLITISKKLEEAIKAGLIPGGKI